MPSDPAARDLRTDWTLDASPGTIRWNRWVGDVVAALSDRDRERRAAALRGLCQLGKYLDGHCDDGGDTLGIEPQDNLTLRFNR